LVEAGLGEPAPPPSKGALRGLSSGSGWSPGRPTVFLYFKCYRWLFLLHYQTIYARSSKWGDYPPNLQIAIDPPRLGRLFPPLRLYDLAPTRWHPVRHVISKIRDLAVYYYETFHASKCIKIDFGYRVLRHKYTH